MNLEKLKKGLQRFHQDNLENKDFFVNEKKYTAADLIVRRYLNDGTSGFGMIKIKTGYKYILKNKQFLIQNNMLSQSAKNNSGFELWANYKF
jgi:hypothetical protein